MPCASSKWRLRSLGSGLGVMDHGIHFGAYVGAPRLSGIVSGYVLLMCLDLLCLNSFGMYAIDSRQQTTQLSFAVACTLATFGYGVGASCSCVAGMGFCNHFPGPIVATPCLLYACCVCEGRSATDFARERWLSWWVNETSNMPRDTHTSSCIPFAKGCKTLSFIPWSG